MIHYETILAGEVRRRKYFRRIAKKYRELWRRCQVELADMTQDKNIAESYYNMLKRDMESVIERRVKEGIASERFAIEYDYCQQIDVLEAKLAVYEKAGTVVGPLTSGMVLSNDQCSRLNAELKRLQGIEKMYASACNKLNRIKSVANEK